MDWDFFYSLILKNSYFNLGSMGFGVEWYGGLLCFGGWRTSSDGTGMGFFAINYLITV